MEHELLKFGGGPSQTIVNPIVLLVVLLAGILMLVIPRNKAIVPFLAAAILIPTDQVIVIGSLHFMMLRVLILFGLVLIIRSKMSPKGKVFSGGMNGIDRAVILCSVFTSVTWILLWQESAAVTFQLGELYTIFGVYCLLRCLIRNREDIELTIRSFAYIAIVIALVMMYEHATGSNPYALLGGARAFFYASLMVREGGLRATGCLGHPILAGTFAAVLLPLFFGLWLTSRKHRTIAVAGMIAVTVMAIASNSSTPLLAYAAGLMGLCFWPLRNQMRLIRWGILLTLVSLHVVMKAPVWHLISRIDVSGGSSGYHRYELVNQCILHFWDWWLLGAKDNGQWGWLMWDTANQYVATAQSSGLLPFLLFLSIIVYGFKYVGKGRRTATSRKDALFVWSLGGSLFAHVMGFFGISYFDQTIVAWYALLALISAAVTISQNHNPQRTAAVESYDLPRDAPDWVIAN